MHRARTAATILAACGLLACPSPTDPDEAPDLLDVTVSPDPATATGPTGRFYVVEHDDEPDEQREYAWRATFAVTVRLTADAADENVGMDFPVDIGAATVRVQQASGGIVTPPTGSQVERYDFVISESTSNRFVGANTSVTMNFEVWYTLPNARREALVSVTLSFHDSGSYQFQEVVPVRVAP